MYIFSWNYAIAYVNTTQHSENAELYQGRKNVPGSGIKLVKLLVPVTVETNRHVKR